MKNVKYYLEYLATRFLYTLVRLLPLQIIRVFGHGLARLAFNVLKIRRRHMQENLKHAFPQKSDSELERVAFHTYKNFLTSLLEYIYLTAPGKNRLEKLVQVQNADLLDATVKASGGVILLTAHFGGWETAGAWLSIKGYQITYMYRKPKNPYIAKLLLQTREASDMNMIEKGAGIRPFLQALQSDEPICLLADQDGGRKGIFVDFMGRPASTPVGPAVLANKTGAPIIFFILYRDSANALHLNFEKIEYEIEGLEKEAAVRAIVIAYTRQLEKWIYKYPDQWFWMHRRWMTKEKKSQK
ncbi:MAG: lysophospholipid acyltransferase family protein [Deferribacteres bacterium]|nr:lysophospholipid acyltransferase family protein [candidate division KSB1 bacterium]MCB9503057.1 lysophospholipid acyltransferase family protein [Deferribacteres bacterium]